jgi:hypothetical protein
MGTRPRALEMKMRHLGDGEEEERKCGSRYLRRWMWEV